MQDLTNSEIERQNILNNKYAVEEIQDAIGIKGIIFENQYRFTIKQVADFFQIKELTVKRYLDKHSKELKTNGYEVLTGERLSVLKKGLVGIFKDTSKINSLGVFNFRAFLNLSMLLTDGERAKDLRKIILDIVIDVMNKRTGGNTKYINFTDRSLILHLFENENHRREFTNALKYYVDMGNVKYPIYTNKIYQEIFKEKAQEYRNVLRLNNKENVRNTMYSQVIKLITSFEIGLADEIKETFEELGRKLSPLELDNIINKFVKKRYWQPLLKDARVKMASRDNHFRNAKHDKLLDYIGPVSEDDFSKFLSERKDLLKEVIKENTDVFKRLRDK